MKHYFTPNTMVVLKVTLSHNQHLSNPIVHDSNLGRAPHGKVALVRSDSLTSLRNMRISISHLLAHMGSLPLVDVDWPP